MGSSPVSGSTRPLPAGSGPDSIRPTPPQLEGWPHIAAGRHTLIAAPTGSGKTLAGFLMCHQPPLPRHATGGAPPRTRRRLRVTAQGPGRRHRREPRAAAGRDRRSAAELGLSRPEITVGVRTGDTPAAERQAMVRRPPTFLVTTPESLYLLVTAARSRDDPVRCRARSSSTRSTPWPATSGAPTSPSPWNVSTMCVGGDGPGPVRIGLSATQRPIETVARLLVGTRTVGPRDPVFDGDEAGPDRDIDCAIVDGGHQRDLDLAIELPDGELEAVASAQPDGERARPHRRAGRRAPHHPGVRQHPPPGRTPRPPARRTPRR